MGATTPKTTPEEAADRVHSAAVRVLRHVRREDLKSGLTPSRLSALSVVVYGGPVTLGELAAAEQVRPPTMTRIVYALEASGLVHKRWDVGDKRTVRLTATPQGRRLMERARKRRTAALAGRLQRLDSDEVDVLAEAARLVEQALRD